MNEPKPLRVAILLPRRERFAQSGAGAVSTVVDGFAQHSRFHASLKVLGTKVTDPLQGAASTHGPQSCGVSIASLGTSATMAVALLLQ